VRRVTVNRIIRIRPSVADQLRRRLHLTGTGCLEFYGALCKRSYGKIGLSLGSRKRKAWVLAHRLAYALQYGAVPTDKDVHHRCENKRCCNPNHLELLDHAVHGKMQGGRYFGPGRPLERAA